MSIINPELEIIQKANNSIRYLEHGWPSDLCRWHFHKQYELHYLINSTGNAFIGDYVGNFKENSLFLVGPFLPHNWVSSNEKIKLRDMIIQFDGDKFNFEEFPEFYELKALLDKSIYGVEFLDIDTKYCFEQFSLIREQKGLKRLILSLEFLNTLSKHKNYKILSLDNVNYKNNLEKDSLISESIDYILENFKQPINIKDMAAMSNLSESSYCRHFLKTLGINFSTFLNKVRVAKACNLLYQSESPVSSICYEVGFQNLSNFNRQFLKLKNTTPRDYRANIQQISNI
jgi:AraC-like DNA-binding protein